MKTRQTYTLNASLLIVAFTVVACGGAPPADSDYFLEIKRADERFFFASALDRRGGLVEINIDVLQRQLVVKSRNESRFAARCRHMRLEGIRPAGGDRQDDGKKQSNLALAKQLEDDPAAEAIMAIAAEVAMLGLHQQPAARAIWDLADQIRRLRGINAR
jgi:hypothetical protein